MTDLLLNALVPVFALIALGYLAGRFKTLDNSHVADLNAFIMQFAVPAALFAAMARLSRDELFAQWSLAALSFGMMIVVYTGWYAWMRHRGVTRAESAVQALTVSFSNFAGVALPILGGLNPHSGVAQAAIGLAVGSIGPTAVTLILIDLEKEDAASRGLGGALLDSLLRPLVVAPVLGALLSLTGLALPPSIIGAFTLLGQASAGGALFLTGLVISAQPIRVGTTTTVATIIMTIVRPAAMFALVRLFHVPPEIGRATVLISAVPAGFFGILLGISNKVPVAATGSMIVLNYVASVVTLTATLALLYAM